MEQNPSREADIFSAGEVISRIMEAKGCIIVFTSAHHLCLF
jgi:hypothetical protein